MLRFMQTVALRQPVGKPTDVGRHQVRFKVNLISAQRIMPVFRRVIARRGMLLILRWGLGVAIPRFTCHLTTTVQPGVTTGLGIEYPKLGEEDLPPYVAPRYTW